MCCVERGVSYDPMAAMEERGVAVVNKMRMW
jgi:hypothetical protein